MWLLQDNPVFKKRPHMATQSTFNNDGQHDDYIHDAEFLEFVSLSQKQRILLPIFELQQYLLINMS